MRIIFFKLIIKVPGISGLSNNNCNNKYLTFIEYLLHARHFSICHIWINLFKLQEPSEINTLSCAHFTDEETGLEG